MKNETNFLEVESIMGSKYIIPLDSIICIFEDNESKTVELYIKNGKSDEIIIQCRTPYEKIRDFLFQS